MEVDFPNRISLDIDFCIEGNRLPLVRKDKNGKDSETYRVIGLVGSFGFTTAGAMAGGYFLGSYLDKRFDTSPWFMMSFIILGVIGSFIEFFKLVKKLLEENNKNHDNRG